MSDILLIDDPAPFVRRLTLNRPDKRNAISFELIDDLLRGLAEVDKSPSQVLIITGAGKAFCSGMDLESLRQLTGRSPEQNRADSETMGRLFRTVYDFPKPTIAAVNGAAIAGGTGLATLCDFTLAVPDAKFGYTEVRIGFVPAIVSTFLLRQSAQAEAIRAGVHWETTFNVAGRLWSMLFHPVPAVRNAYSWQDWGILVGGLLFTLLCAGLFILR